VEEDWEEEVRVDLEEDWVVDLGAEDWQFWEVGSSSWEVVGSSSLEAEGSFSWEEEGSSSWEEEGSSKVNKHNLLLFDVGTLLWPCPKFGSEDTQNSSCTRAVFGSRNGLQTEYQSNPGNVI
jgi:hypothetical protein